MQLLPLGDSAILVVLTAKTHAAALDLVERLAWALNNAPLVGVSDIVPAYTTVVVHYDPVNVAPGAGTPFERVQRWILSAPSVPLLAKRPAAREVVIPVCYGGEYGPDLAHVAKHTRLTEAEVVQLHSKGVYRVAAVGFLPGFPYLLGMSPKLATPRLPTPRTGVPAGSVGIGGVQTGVYPANTPGGWVLIGRTPARLFRPEDEADPTLLKTGDKVKFTVITPEQAAKQMERVAPLITPKVSKQSAAFEVLKPGMLTTVQDLGRPGRQHQGISVGGPMDRTAARVANVLLGNDENEPLLELTVNGPELLFLRECWIAVTGAEVRGVPGWRPWKVDEGQIVVLTELVRGARAYLAIAGGLEVARVLGGTGTMLSTGVGGWNGRALKTGDRLGIRPGILELEGRWSASAEFRATSLGEVIVRFIAGPQWDWFSAESRRSFLSDAFKITAKSDRMGLRLDGPQLSLASPSRELLSEGIAFGSVQVPPDGRPIVLMADRQTVGGYPKIAQVITVDLAKLAQARTSETVKFQEVTLAQAQTLYLEHEHSLAMLASGVRAKVKRG